jgi:hypothetical protein
MVACAASCCGRGRGSERFLGIFPLPEGAQCPWPGRVGGIFAIVPSLSRVIDRFDVNKPE